MHQMDRFFHPQSIVIFGASGNINKSGNAVFLNLKRYCESNQISRFYIVHPKENEIQGVKCYRTLSDLPETDRIDLAILVIPPDAVMEVVRSCIAFNVRGILIESANLHSDDDKAAQYACELRTLIQKSDIRIIGPNAIGFNVPKYKYSTPLKRTVQFVETRERNVSFCAQSGLFATSFIETFFNSQPYGIAKFAAIGNKLDLNECDVLEYYLQDPDTHVIAMYLEDIKNGPRFINLIRSNFTSKVPKPIVILKSGRSVQGQHAISSHTGSLAGNYRIFEGIAHQFGLYLVDTYQELFELAGLLCRYPKIQGDRIGVVSISGSGCVLAADFAEKYHLRLNELPNTLKEELRPLFPDWAPIHNPLDTWVSTEKVGSVKSFNEIFRIMLKSGCFDAIVTASLGSPVARYDFEMIQHYQNEYPHIPILLFFFGGDHYQELTSECIKREIPIYSEYESNFKYLGKMVENSKKR